MEINNRSIIIRNLTMGLLVIINFTACTYYFPGNKNFFQITIRTAPDHHNQVKFNISRQYISLKNYFIKSIRVEKNNELCNIPMKKPTLIWSLYNNDKNNPVSEIPYGIKSNPPRLSANTIYLVKVTVKNKKNKQLGMGRNIFVISSNGNVFSPSTSAEVEEVCQKYLKQGNLVVI